MALANEAAAGLGLAALATAAKCELHGQQPGEVLIQAVPRPTLAAPPAATATRSSAAALDDSSVAPLPSAHPAVGAAAAPALREAASLLARAAEAAEAEAAAAAAARARASALEAELRAEAAAARAREAELQAAAAAAHLHRGALEAELEATAAASRGREAILGAELAAERAERGRLAAELVSTMQAAAAANGATEVGCTGGVRVGDTSACGTRDDEGGRLAAENARLSAKVQAYRALIQKQQRIIREHEARLHTYGMRALSAVRGQRKRRCLSIGGGYNKRSTVVDNDVAEPKDAARSPVLRPPLADSPACVKEVTTVDLVESAIDAAAVNKPAPHPEQVAAATATPTEVTQEQLDPTSKGEVEDFPIVLHSAHPELPTADALVVPDSRSRADNNDATSTVATAATRPRADLVQVPGLRILEIAGPRGHAGRTRGCGPANGPRCPPLAAATVAGAGSGNETAAVKSVDVECPAPRVVRAEGLAAAAAMAVPPSGVPCRCVVRNKEARLGLQAFDCEQCRGFFNATCSVGGKGSSVAAVAARAAWRTALRASRHRFEHAPTSTPPGFWDLSFPHGPDDHGARGHAKP